ncbi:MAG: hypothetical protein ACJ75R_10750 [Solirubrobacterales bacterium]
MDANRSTEGPLGGLTPAERIAAIGALVVIASPLLPWYGVPVGGGLSKTALDNFGLAALAMLITAGAALTVIARRMRGHTLPRPLGVGGLLIACGVWIGLLVCYLIAARPDQLAGSDDVNLRIGPFVCLGGAIAIVVGGMRVRGLGTEDDDSET